MIPQIASVLSRGFTSKQVIDFILRKYPQHADKIKSAMAAGFSVDQVLKYISGGRKALTEESPALTEHEQTRKIDIGRRETVNKGALGAAALAATSLAAPMATAALGRAIPNSLKGMTPSLTTALQQQTQQPIPPQQPPLVQPSVNTSQPNIPQTQPITQPEQIINPEEYLEKRGVLQKVKEMLSAKNTPEAIAATLGIKDKSGRLKAEVDPELLENIEALAKKQPAEVPKTVEFPEHRNTGTPIERNLPSNKRVEQFEESRKKIRKNFDSLSQEDKILERIDFLKENLDLYDYDKDQIEQVKKEISKLEKEYKEYTNESLPIKKNETVVSPQGVGEVKEIRNGKAIVEIDGKKHQVDEDDLESEPKDVADLYDDLFNAIPDQYKSRMMNYAGYDEESNELLFRPHGGAAYVYKDIPPEFAEELKNRLHKAKTSGSNMYGMWSEGDQSYGAGMSKLIKELQAQYGGKGKEYVRKFNTLFDILGIPHEEKKRKEQEKRRKRKESR